ncbi:MAG: uracil-DNA glycosylase [Hydrogenophaga sp.]|nr:uracil-DNA glycosylase [Hydrogenophaga sp.]
MSDAPDTSFVPELDARQRAMLAEMGVRVWAPKPAPAQIPAVAVHDPVAAPAPRAVAVAAPMAAPALTPPAQATPSRPASPVATLDWPALRDAVASCQACGLCQGRTNTVFGVGDEQADWMVVGEAPGENEDLQGEPFVGAAGQLLDNMLKAVGRSRTGKGAEGAYITNVLKCRPPANRNPQADEVASCEPYLARQVALVKPKVIVAMGRFAVQALLKTNEPIGRLRGQMHHYEGVPVIVTYHPAYLLRTPADKGKAWADLCLAMAQLPA